MTKWIFAIITCFFTGLTFSQDDIPTDYFTDPLEVPLYLSGSFGELRSNHFHSGLDIKTQQRTGLPVVAAADGFVSRINVANYGYGKALYIQHPNGYTTVYGHLENFSPEIEDYIKKLQYKKESYEVEVYPSANELKVTKGQLVANSGNTGGSGGPHLHFEIRDGQQRPMNPLMFGIDIKDTRAPLVKGLYVYPLGEEAHVNGSTKMQKLNLIPQQDGSYVVPKLEACGIIGFGINTVDQMDGQPNQNGVYRIETNVNSDKIFQANFEKFSFAETRHLNKLIDYGYYSKNKSRIQKLFVEPSNPLSIYSDVRNEGLLNIQDSLSYDYVIRITDIAGNERVVKIPIIGKMKAEVPPKEERVTNYFVQANQPAQFEEKGIDVYFPKNVLYEDIYLDMVFEDEKVKVHEDEVPVISNFTIGFDVSKYKPEDRKQLFIARLNKWGNPNYSSTNKDGDRFTTNTRTFGTYTLATDNTPPRVSPVNFKDGQWISSNKDLKIRISDDLSGIDSFRATVNGKWILMEYEYKNNLLTHDFSDGVVTDNENQLKVEVTDNVGNTTVYEATFFRK